ncbi:Uncharacterised protein [Legionella lansingensis]|uniref:Uncharacterized protein n=1 Tax=Legionella lansingensis TaxID=45067 RepID=A0A0W0VTT2_9GAMM|nr:hypothetical protein Llan_0888 [Legionella lansingensis]SNV49497.1 Uncharacterised protein [Legionella lansingensis]
MLVKFIALVLLGFWSFSSYADIIIPDKKAEFMDGFFSPNEKLSLVLILIGIIILVFVWRYVRRRK